MKSMEEKPMLPKRIEAKVIALAQPFSYSVQGLRQRKPDMVSPITSERIVGELRTIESAAARRATDDELGKPVGTIGFRLFGS
jgi:hypothetical protein